MKRLTLLSAVLALTALAPSCTSPSKSHASDEVHAVPASASSEEEMMQKWMAFATPGEAHQLLNDRVGHWSMVVKQFMPDMPEPMVSSGQSEMKWIFDGRYIQDMTSGETMGMPFNGQGTTGYDNIKRKYVASWIDNVGTGLAVSEGTYDAASRTFNYVTQGPDPVADSYVPMRVIERWSDRDHWVMQAFMHGSEGKEYMCMEIEYTRM